MAASSIELTADFDATVSELTWTHEQGVDLARKVEAVAPGFGYHVALTGGLLYKDGPRKDCDLMLYRTHAVMDEDNAREPLLEALANMGLVAYMNHGYCVKATWEGKPVDLLFPDEPRSPGDYTKAQAIEWEDV